MKRYAWFVSGLLLVSPVWGEPPEDEGPTVTEQWLALQASGREASSQPQGLPGDARVLIYQRFLDSFKQPIPASYIDSEYAE